MIDVKSRAWPLRQASHVFSLLGGSEIDLDAVGGPGGDAGAEEVLVFGPDRALQGDCRCEDRPVVGVSLFDSGEAVRRNVE